MNRGFRKPEVQGFESLRWLHRIKKLGRLKSGLFHLVTHAVTHSVRTDIFLNFLNCFFDGLGEIANNAKTSLRTGRNIIAHRPYYA